MLQLLRRDEDPVPVANQVAGPGRGADPRPASDGGAERGQGQRRGGDDAGAGGDAAGEVGGVRGAADRAPRGDAVRKGQEGHGGGEP